MDLQADVALWMSLVDLFVRQIGNHVAVDPGLDSSTLGDDAILIPLTVLKEIVSVLFVFWFRREPAVLG